MAQHRLFQGAAKQGMVVGDDEAQITSSGFSQFILPGSFCVLA
jgi:hypothetical protein